MILGSKPCLLRLYTLNLLRSNNCRTNQLRKLPYGNHRHRHFLLCPPSFSSSLPTPPSTQVVYDSEDDDDEDDDTDTESDPEIALILAAIAIGVVTGGSVVVFNDAIHSIRDAIWHGETLLTGRELLAQFSELELWPRIVFPPVLGGFFVGLLGLLTGGYADPPSSVAPLPRPSPFPQNNSKNNNLDRNNKDITIINSNSSLNSDNSSSSSSKNAAEMDIIAKIEWKRKIDSVTRPVARAIAAAVTLGTGASLGPEGPSVDIGRSFAKGLSSVLRDPQRHLTSLVAAGSGAGVAAGFNAPIAGVFFAVETVLQRQLLGAVASSSDQNAKQAQKQAQRMEDSSALTVAMVLLASVVAAVVSQAGLGSSPAFRVPEYRLQSMYELPLFLVFGMLCGAVSASFSYSARVAEDAFTELKQSPDNGGNGSAGIVGSALLPALGGLTTGVLALGYPEILYQGFDNVSSVLSSNGEYPPGLLVQIVVLKIIATTISRGSGLQGGIYAPSIFIGAALGSAFGLFVHTVGDSTGLILSAPQAYALVGVAAMLASNCGVPLTAILLLFELTRDYLIIVPTLAAVGISFWISSLAAPGVKSAAARRQRRRAAAMAAASASPADAALLETLKERLLDGATLLQDNVTESSSNASILLGGDPSTAILVEEERKNSDSDTSEGNNPATSSSISLSASLEQTEQSLMLACAADKGCLLLQENMSLTDALALMEEEDQTAAVVVGNRGGIVGLVSRDIVRAAQMARGENDDDDNPTVKKN
jgi:H+/Cl- antiporter ClcA